MVKKWLVIALCMGIVFMVNGCETPNKQQKKIKDCEYTVVEYEELPRELQELIEERKEEPFKLSFGEEGYLYIARGYGKQAGGGYSITVANAYETKEEIYFETNLMGPTDTGEPKGETYPYIVIKMEYVDKEVVYE